MKTYNFTSAWGTTTPVYLKALDYQNNGRLAVQAYEAETNFPFMTITVNVPDEKVKNNRSNFVKSYSENEGVLDFLLDNDLAHFVGTMSHQGFPQMEFHIEKF